MENHGVVVGADSISDLEVLLANLVRLFQNPLIKMDKIDIAIVPEIHFKLKQSYSLCSDVDLIQLATNINLSSRLDNEWALYPDHIVFLGEEAVILDGAMTQWI